MLPPRRAPLLAAFALLVLVIFVGLYRLLKPSAAYHLIGNRSEFTSNACVDYDPTGTARHRTVFLDPGHGGPDPGASGVAPNGSILQEKTLTLATALDMLPMLRKDGYRVAMSRITDAPVARIGAASLTGTTYSIAGEHQDIASRVDCANAAQAQVLLSIHFDSYSDPSVGGVETLYDSARPFAAQNMRFANIVQNTVLAGFTANGWHVPDRGIINDSTGGTPALTARAAAYGHLLELGPASPGWFNHPSQMPGALCEPLFLTDPGEAAVAASATGRQVLARALVAAVNAYFKG